MIFEKIQIVPNFYQGFAKAQKIINLIINTQIENVTTISERNIDPSEIFLSLCLSESRFFSLTPYHKCYGMQAKTHSALLLLKL